MPDAADTSAAVEVTATEATCDRSADDSADDDPAFLIGGQGESESGPMESRAARPPRRDELHAFGLVNSAARSLDARENVAPQERVVCITPANRRKCHAGFPCRRRHRKPSCALALMAVRAPCAPKATCTTSCLWRSFPPSRPASPEGYGGQASHAARAVQTAFPPQRNCLQKQLAMIPLRMISGGIITTAQLGGVE